MKTKKPLVLSSFCIVSLAGTAASGGLVARPQGFDPAPLARQEVMGRGYWTQSCEYETGDRAFPGNKSTGIADLPVFRDHAVGSGFGNRRPVKGKWR